METIIESIQLREIYFDANNVCQEYIVTEYLVKRASDGYPIRQFKSLREAEHYSRELMEEE